VEQIFALYCICSVDSDAEITSLAVFISAKAGKLAIHRLKFIFNDISIGKLISIEKARAEAWVLKGFHALISLNMNVEVIAKVVRVRNLGHSVY
jgi:hypothetical protein